MDRVRRRSPSDTEAAIFYALALIAVGQANATDTTFTYQKRADSILEPLFRREPRHPGLAHYLIHTNDVPQLAQHGLYAARRYAEIAPGVPHAQHMPSHIFTRLGLWDDDIASNTRSAAVARAYEVERGLHAMWDQRAHALDYLAYAYLQEGRDTAARRVVDEAAAAPAGYPTGSLTHDYAFAAIPARFDLERWRWAEAARLAVCPAGDLGGDLLRALHEPAAAAQAYRRTLALSPNRARSLFGLAQAAAQAGDLAVARATYQQFLNVTAQADGARPEIAIARRAVASR